MAFVYTIEKVERLLSDEVHSGYNVTMKCTDDVSKRSTSCEFNIPSTEVVDRTLKTKIQTRLNKIQESGTSLKQDCESALVAVVAPTVSVEEHDTLLDAVLTV